MTMSAAHSNSTVRPPQPACVIGHSTLIVGLLAVFGAVAIGIAWGHEGHQALPTKGARVDGNTIYLSAEAHQALQLTTAEVALKEMETTITATATVVVPWQRHAYATTKLGGKLESVACRPGDYVTAGQKLADVESQELENEQLELIETKLELALAQQTLDRAELLGKTGIVSERDVRAAQTTKLERSSTFDVMKRKLTSLGIAAEMLDRVLQTEQPVRTLSIVSPSSGIIVHGDAQPGRIVEPTEHLFEIIDLSTVWVEALVVEAETHRLRVGQPARVSLAGLPGRQFDGKIDVIGLRADPATRAVPVRISLSNPDARNPLIRPGMFGSVQIVTYAAPNRVVCPVHSLVTAGAESYVFVEQKRPGKGKPGEYVKRNVVLGLRSRTGVEILQGLFPGDDVVVKGGHQLSSFFVQGVLTLTLEAQRNIRLVLQPVELRPVAAVVSVNAAIEVPPDRRAAASSRIPGRVRRILVDVSDPVKASQIVAEVESIEFQNVQLELVQTKTRLGQIQELLERARQLKTVIAQQEVLQREIESRKTLNQLNGLKRRLEAIGLTSETVAAVERGELIEALPVRSPIDGFVVHSDVIPGQVIRSETPLIEIHDLGRVWVRGFVFEKDLPKVRLGQAVRVRLASDPAFLAETTLVRTNNVLSSTERVLSVWAELDNPDRKLKDNMLARMTIEADVGPRVTAVPTDAVLRDGSDTYVFVKKLEKSDYFDRRPVRVGRRDDRFVEITTGLAAGELVAIGGVQELRTAYAGIK